MAKTYKIVVKCLINIFNRELKKQYLIYVLHLESNINKELIKLMN
jgi:hypothetical protein